MSRVMWTPAEDDVLRRLYQTRGGVAACRSALPHRTISAIHERARKRLKLSATRPRWTAAEDERLRFLWGDGNTLEQIAESLGRPWRGVYYHAQMLGLPLGCPQGFEYFTVAAERVGLSRSTLARVLKQHKVRMYPALGVGTGAHRQRVVDIGDVDAAVEDYLAREPVQTAARRVGVNGQRLRRRLRRIGVTTTRHKHTLRVTDEQVRLALGEEAA